jgi:hypothetical protein
MAIWNINFSTLWQQLLPPILRQPVEEAWGTSLTYPLQYNNVLFTDYLTGSTYPLYVSATTYTTGERVIYIDRGVYENLSGSTGVYPFSGSTNWELVNSNYIGAIERSQYNARKLDYEFALNRWFEVSGFCPTVIYTAITQSLFAASAQTIYIENNVVTSAVFMMGNSGLYSGKMAANSLYSTVYMGDSFSGVSNNNYTIWVPNIYYSALSESIIASFADTINMGGMGYSVSGY